MKPLRTILFAVLLGGLIGFARWIFECLFVVPLVPDPQISIWALKSATIGLFFAINLTAAACLALRGFQTKSEISVAAGSIVFLVLLGLQLVGLNDLCQTRAALIDSADSKTGAGRLRELANSSDGPGYEIDNRIAKHPNTPPDVLRNDKWRDYLQSALKRNPRYHELRISVNP